MSCGHQFAPIQKCPKCPSMSNWSRGFASVCFLFSLLVFLNPVVTALFSVCLRNDLQSSLTLWNKGYIWNTSDSVSSLSSDIFMQPRCYIATPFRNFHMIRLSTDSAASSFRSFYAFGMFSGWNSGGGSVFHGRTYSGKLMAMASSTRNQFFVNKIQGTATW